MSLNVLLMKTLTRSHWVIIFHRADDGCPRQRLSDSFLPAAWLCLLPALFAQPDYRPRALDSKGSVANRGERQGGSVICRGGRSAFQAKGALDEPRLSDHRGSLLAS